MHYPALLFINSNEKAFGPSKPDRQMPEQAAYAHFSTNRIHKTHLFTPG